MGSKNFKPLFNHVVIENPLTKEAGEETKKKLEKLPAKEREEVLKAELESMLHGVKIVQIGPDVKSLKVGMKISISMRELERAFSVGKDLLVVRESSEIYGTWE